MCRRLVRTEHKGGRGLPDTLDSDLEWLKVHRSMRCSKNRYMRAAPECYAAR